MQDYDTCLSTLRLLASDLKADKEWRHYAAVQVRFPLSNPHVTCQVLSTSLLISMCLRIPECSASTCTSGWLQGLAPSQLRHVSVIKAESTFLIPPKV